MNFLAMMCMKCILEEGTLQPFVSMLLRTLLCPAWLAVQLSLAFAVEESWKCVHV